MQAAHSRGITPRYRKTVVRMREIYSYSVADSMLDYFLINFSLSLDISPTFFFVICRLFKFQTIINF